MRKHPYYKEAFFTHRDGREVCNDTAAGKRDYTGRTVEMWERQDGKCAICGNWIELRYATFDHEEPRGMGGGSRDDRTVVNGEWHNAAVHGICNTRKGSKRYQWVNGKYLPVPSRVELAKEVA